MHERIVLIIRTLRERLSNYTRGSIQIVFLMFREMSEMLKKN